MRWMKRILACLLCVGLVYTFWMFGRHLQPAVKTVSSCGQWSEGRRNTNFPLYQSPQKKAQLECRFAERKNILKRACGRDGRTDSTKRLIKKLSTDHKTPAFCVIQKAGSSFWKSVVSGYSQHREKTKGKDTHGNIFIGIHEPNLTTPSTLYTFVRNPYTRLLSGYVDKIFSVNPLYWIRIGRDISKTVPHKTLVTNSSFPCGHNITFPEFVDFILYSNDNNNEIDRHFNPTHRHCGFCKIDYDYVGKMETFLDDMVYISNAVGLLDNKVSKNVVVQRGLEGVRAMIHENSKNVFQSRRSFMEGCGVTLIEGLRVTWKRWQIRGMISMKIPFPLTSDDANVTFETFNELAQKAHNMSDRHVLTVGKQRALREAYGSLTHEVKVKLRKLFEPEFQMFGYDPMPDFVFGKYRKDDQFSFFDNKFL